MPFFDTHAHVNLEAFKDDRDDTVKRSLDAQTWMINVGTDSASSKIAVDMADKYPEGVFASVGLHPTESEIFDDSGYETGLSEKVVAVGECGLDYFRLPEEGREAAIRKQKTEFVKQLDFAKKHGLPVIIHCRDAYPDLLEILKKEYSGFQGVVHSFTDSWDTARQFLDLGFYIALNGILTFDKTGRLAEVVEKVPFEKLLTETDAPYLTPPPFRGKRNEPSYVQYVAAKIAEIKKMDVEVVGEQTFENARALFKIKKKPTNSP
ncbi:MAG: TatD family hydrolase [Candidatus Doudnabacteria bacterium]